MVFMLVILSFPTSPDPQASTMNYTSVVLGGVMFLAVAWYYFPVYGGVHWFRGPMFTVEDKSESMGNDGSVEGKLVEIRENVVL